MKKGTEVPFAACVASRRTSRPSAAPQTRLRYSWVRVSISILSPWATKIGTGMSKPVEIFVAQGDKIEIDTRTHEYRKRV